MKGRPDYFRSLDAICDVDERNTAFGVVTPEGTRSLSLDEHHRRLDQIRLSENVPEEVVIQFETSKNVYLYSWFVYRFGPVAELHAAATLELALKKCFSVEDGARTRGPGFSRLLHDAVSGGRIRPEQLTAWEEHAVARARQRLLFEQIEIADATGVDEVAFDESDFVVQPDDYDPEFLKWFVRRIKYIRNDGAHGSRRLDFSGLRTLRDIAEIINQLFERT